MQQGYITDSLEGTIVVGVKIKQCESEQLTIIKAKKKAKKIVSNS